MIIVLYDKTVTHLCYYSWMEAKFSKPFHNHQVDSPCALRHRDVDSTVDRRLKCLLSAHHTPAQAQERLKQQLQAECSSTKAYALASADRAVIPDYQYICR